MAFCTFMPPSFCLSYFFFFALLPFFCGRRTTSPASTKPTFYYHLLFFTTLICLPRYHLCVPCSSSTLPCGGMRHFAEHLLNLLPYCWRTPLDLRHSFSTFRFAAFCYFFLLPNIRFACLHIPSLHLRKDFSGRGIRLLGCAFSVSEFGWWNPTGRLERNNSAFSGFLGGCSSRVPRLRAPVC